KRPSVIYGSRLTETLCSLQLRNLSRQKMQHRSRKSAMALTADLVARVERVEPDPGPTPGQEYLTEADYDALSHELIQENHGGPFWVFAYGSLIWKPECALSEHRRATAH